MLVFITRGVVSQSRDGIADELRGLLCADGAQNVNERLHIFEMLTDQALKTIPFENHVHGETCEELFFSGRYLPPLDWTGGAPKITEVHELP